MDTLRADYLSVYGSSEVRMPFVARMAQEGMVFEHAVSTSSWTAPSSASLLTGVYPDRHGVQQGFMANLSQLEAGSGELELNGISARTATLAEVLQGRGYRTFGLASNINIGPEMGFGRGFEHFERLDEASAEVLHGRLMNWKEELRGGGPFFLYLHLNDVHKPYQRREPWYEASSGLPEVALYRSEMGYLDHWIERMLTDIGLDDETLLVITSDHGEEFEERGAIGHHMSLYSEVNRIVMLFHAPGLGIQPGRSQLEVSGIDLAPSIMELLGARMPDDRGGDALDGLSLAPFMAGGIADRFRARRMQDLDTRVLIGHRQGSRGGNLYCATKDRWKLIRKRGKDFLYDLEADPGETVNLRAKEREHYRFLAAAIKDYEERDYPVEFDPTAVKIDAELLDKLGALGYTER